jgi:hypothetical protein
MHPILIQALTAFLLLGRLMELINVQCMRLESKMVRKESTIAYATAIVGAAEAAGLAGAAVLPCEFRAQVLHHPGLPFRC